MQNFFEVKKSRESLLHCLGNKDRDSLDSYHNNYPKSIKLSHSFLVTLLCHRLGFALFAC